MERIGFLIIRHPEGSDWSLPVKMDFFINRVRLAWAARVLKSSRDGITIIDLPSKSF
jgi:hypothetical protein